MTDSSPTEPITPEELRSVWPVLLPEERVESFQLLPREVADEFFLSLAARGRATILRGSSAGQRRTWMRLMAPDDAVDVLQECSEEERRELIDLLDGPTRREVTALLAYAEDQAGGLMSPRFARARPDMTVEEAISYLRRQAPDKLETIYYVYVLDASQVLQGVVSFRDLFTAPGTRRVREVMRTEVVSVPEHLDQEAVATLVAHHDLMALPVVDADGRMKGIVTVDDVVDVFQSEATEDMHKIGGMEALAAPYMQTGFLPMLRKRAGWLAVLFLGEMLTTSAMGRYEDEIARALVLAIFVPLIISSGGNSGSQASTLVIRAMALGEVRPRDWWRIIRRELATGFSLGIVLAVLGVIRILGWQALFGEYGEHYGLVAATVSLSLVGVVTWGTLAGSMLPFVLRKLGFDSASASAPLVATLADVSGIVIYFNVAYVLLSGTML